MDLPVMPPLRPMLAKPAARLPEGWLYDPKWDGFRTVVFRDGDEVELGSRNQKPLTRYFPELVEAVRAELPQRCVVDGEIVASADGHRLDFEALGQRIHPAASRIERLSRELPVGLVVFDLLALDDEDLTDRPLRERRARLEEILPARSAGSVHRCPMTDDVDEAMRWYTAFEGAGLDGVIAKDPEDRYRPNERVLVKLKHTRTADVVVAGCRPYKQDPQAVGSLLLGLYRPDGSLQPVGVAASFTAQRRRALATELAPLITDLDDHPWAVGAFEENRWTGDRDRAFVPLRPERVAEVRYDYLEGDRFRHTTHFQRWRPDRDPASCTHDQLEQVEPYPIADVLGAPVTGAGRG